MDQNKGGFFRRLLSQSFLLLNILAVIWLALCAAASVVSPVTAKYLALFSLTIPFCIVVNIFFIVFWLFSRHKARLFLSLFFCLIFYKISLSVFGFNIAAKNDMSRGPEKIKIMSWNAHGMGLFNRPRNKVFDKQLVDFIKQEDADILCLLEYPTPRATLMKPFASKIIDNSGYKEFRFKDDNILSKIVFLGTAVFSKYPFKNYMAYKLSEYIYLLQGDVELTPNTTIRMFFVHLNTFGLSDNDKAYIEEMKSKGADDYIDSSKTLISKLTRGFVKRSEEADMAAKIIAKSPYPVVVCGDMNDLPGSYTYTQMRGGLDDIFVAKGLGLGRTYNMISPTLRIDHMFYDPKVLKPVGLQIPYTALSDHNPLIANFEIIPQPR